MQCMPQTVSAPHDVLLASGASGGTIAAVRQLARSGVKVGVISSQMLCAASWSRFASSSYDGPRERQSQEFLDLLLDLGAASPGRVLLPTSDETAWLYASNSARLKEYFHLHQPPVETMRRIMDKNLLSQAVLEAGLAVLPTWQAQSCEALLAIAPTLLYPILIKPRTQVHRVQNHKGMVAYSEAELVEKFQAFVSRETFAGGGQQLPDAAVPLLQHFVDIGSEGVYSVSGYIDQTGEVFVTRHAKKVLQRSLPVGVGVCFESLPADPALSSSVQRLCRELGFFGIFEVEFIRFEGRWAVIDFNPRLFNQAGMDARRGMPLPLMAYLDAAGKVEDLKELVARSQEQDADRPAVFYDRFTLWAILTAKTLTGRASAQERAYWREWTRRHAAHSVDFVIDPKDPLPGVVHILSEIFLGIKAFRKFLRSTDRSRTQAEPLVTKVAS